MLGEDRAFSKMPTRATLSPPPPTHHTRTHAYDTHAWVRPSPTGSAMDGATVLAAACPKERSVKVLDLATGTVYFTFADTAVPLAGNGMATIAGAGSAEVWEAQCTWDISSSALTAVRV